MSPVISDDNKAAQTPRSPKRHSPIFLAVFAVFILMTTFCVLATPLGAILAGLTSHDTICFWTSGRLLVHGHNPYEREAVGAIEAALGFHVNPQAIFMMREPPTALYLIAPLGLLGPREGVFAWALLLAACLAISVRSIASVAERPYERNLLWLGCCFAPALACIEIGQTALIVLLGLTLFLRFHHSRPFWAGAALSLCAMKPHLLLPFGVVLLVWVVVSRKWTILAGAVATTAIESGIPMLFDRAVWPHYLAAMRTESIMDEFVPTLGTGLRFLVDRKAMWLQFVPAALGCAWALWYFWRNRAKWDWRTHGSLLTLVSLMVAPYSWLTDSAIAIPAILFALLGPVPPRRGSLTLLLALMCAAAAAMLTTSVFYSKPNLLAGIAWLAWYLYAASGRKPVDEHEVLSDGLTMA
ncbi:MAG: glycosyltransferase family 87 protein [Acidobacteriaceae bacterium]